MGRTKVAQDKPLITFVIAVFNGGKTLERCLNSILSQTYPRKEIVVIDGGSADETVDILRRHSAGIDYWESKPDRGIYDAWNKGIENSNGEWICFLGADDFLWQSNVLEQFSNHLSGVYPEIRIVYGRVAVVNDEEQVIDQWGEDWRTMRDKFLGGTCLPTPAVMHHRGLFEQHGLYDETFRIAGDYEMLLRELKAAEAVFVSDVILTGMQHGGISSRPDSAITSIREVGIALQKHCVRLPIRWHLALVRIRARQMLWALFGEAITRRLLDFGRRIMGKQEFWTKV